MGDEVGMDEFGIKRHYNHAFFSGNLLFNLPSYHLISQFTISSHNLPSHLFFLVSHVTSHSHLPPPWTHQPETAVMVDQFICLTTYHLINHLNRVQLPLILPPPPPSHETDHEMVDCETDHEMVDGERGGGGDGICSLTCGNETKQVLKSHNLPSHYLPSHDLISQLTMS